MDQKNILESKKYDNLSTHQLLDLSRSGSDIPLSIFIQRFNNELNPEYLELIDYTTPEDKLISTVQDFDRLYKNNNYLNLSPEDFFVHLYTLSGGILPDSFKLDSDEWIFRPQYPLIRAIAKKDLNLVKLAVEVLEYEEVGDKKYMLNYLEIGLEEAKKINSPGVITFLNEKIKKVKEKIEKEKIRLDDLEEEYWVRIKRNYEEEQKQLEEDESRYMAERERIL